ncbi:MAG: hypothetical protein ACT4TC_11250 [Myxococcaceae bacterium]
MASKRVLVVHFTQSGQLTEVLQHVTRTLQADSGVELDWYSIVPQTPYPFPWTGKDFFGVFPDSVKEVPCALREDAPLGEGYDLIILGYQPWFLSPSIPMTSFLKSTRAKTVVKDTPVVTVIACRNMWISGQERMKELIRDAGGQLVGNIALDDRSGNLTSLVTLFHWMLTGKRERVFGVLPPPGVAQADVAASEQFGAPLLAALLRGDWRDLQSELVARGAVEIRPYLMTLETRARKVFELWASFVSRAPVGPARDRRLALFRNYLLTGLFVLSPTSWIATQVTTPLLRGSIAKRLRYFRDVRAAA